MAGEGGRNQGWGNWESILTSCVFMRSVSTCEPRGSSFFLFSNWHCNALISDHNSLQADILKLTYYVYRKSPHSEGPSAAHWTNSCDSNHPSWMEKSRAASPMTSMACEKKGELESRLAESVANVRLGVSTHKVSKPTSPYKIPQLVLREPLDGWWVMSNVTLSQRVSEDSNSRNIMEPVTRCYKLWATPVGFAIGDKHLSMGLNIHRSGKVLG